MEDVEECCVCLEEEWCLPVTNCCGQSIHTTCLTRSLQDYNHCPHCRCPTSIVSFFFLRFFFLWFFSYILSFFQVMILKSKEEYETLVKAIGHKQTKRIFRSDDMKRFFKIFQSRGPIVEACDECSGCPSHVMFAQCFNVPLSGIITIVQATTFQGILAIQKVER